MGGSSKKQTVGYWYKLLYHAGLCKGPIDAFLEFRGGDRTAWQGNLTASGTLNINQPKLWGGTEEQGGIVSDVDVMFGEATQAPNAYLLANLGAQVPAWRGLATLVFKGGKYGAMNPYPQKASYKIRKIKQGWDGACWYPEKAEIPIWTFSWQYDDLWAYKVVSAADGGAPGVPAEFISAVYDDSAWPVGLGGFGSGTYYIALGLGTYVSPGYGKGIWIRKHLNYDEPAAVGDLNITIYHDDGRWLWWNGEAIPVVQQPSYYHSIATIPAAKILAYNVIVMQVLDSIPGGSPAQIYAGMSINRSGTSPLAMNPAHVLYFARTNSDLGREPTANINDASLTAAADTLYAEGFGICTTRDPANESVEEFEQRISKLIDGAFQRDPITGQWHLDLARGDYVLGDLPILTDDDILDFKELPSTLDNAINSVSVKYFDPEKKETITTPPVQARALIAAFGTIHQTLDYPEIPTAGLAARVALRELRATATPTRAFDLVCTRKPLPWRVNTYFRIQAPKRGIADMVCIVGEKESGSLKSGAIRLKTTQDIYSMPATSFVEVEPGVDTDPTQTPVPITAQAAFEAPYIEVVSTLSRAEMEVLPADIGYLATVAADPAASTNYTAMVDAGAGYVEAVDGDWCPSAVVVEAASWPDTAFTLSGATRLDEVVVGSAALWGDEIVRVDAIDPAAGTVTLARGCADTVPDQHAAGTRIWFYQDNAAVDLTEYTAGETLAIKLLTNTSSQQLDIASASAMSLDIVGRAVLPYPPGNVKINGAYYPVALAGNPLIAFGWAHRDRLLQADQLIDTLQASVGPETDTTYTLRLYGETDTLLRTETGLTGASYTWTAEGGDSGLGASSDPHWANVVALLHMDGPDGSTTFTDSTGRSWTAAGAAQIRTDRSKFGGAAAQFEAAGARITAVNSAALRFGTAPWVVEGWFQPQAPVTGFGGFYIKGENSADGISLAVTPTALTFRANGTTDTTVTVSLSTTDFTYIAFVYDGTSIRFIVGGTEVGSAVRTFNHTSTAALLVGSATSNSVFSYRGRIDDLRITAGVARPTPLPSDPFPGPGGSRLNGRIRAELESVRGSLTSHQKHNITVDRAGWGYQWGNYWGGP